MPICDDLAPVLLQRMRRLNRAERTILMRAAVIGRRFHLAVLTATTAVGEHRVRAILEKACTLQLTIRESSHDDWYAFRHALIRDVAYEEFVRTRVLQVHRLIARAFERCADETGTSLDDLAYHFWAGRDARRCVHYNELAGDRAVAVFANQDARIYYTRAREFTHPRSERYRRLTSKLAGLQGDE